MLPVFDSLRGLTFASITVRLVLCVLCGGVICIEREYKRRPAGFRTHILICLGAAMTTLTSQYLLLYLGYNTDVSRMGAQVIAGIGFIGTGAIIVTRRKRVKGLTTAAGLWASAIVGLALGAGFFEGALYATLLIVAAELIFSKVEYRMMRNSPEINLYVEYTSRDSLDGILQMLHNRNIKVLNMEITRTADSSKANSYCAIFSLQLAKRHTAKDTIDRIVSSPGVVLVEEL